MTTPLPAYVATGTVRGQQLVVSGDTASDADTKPDAAYPVGASLTFTPSVNYLLWAPAAGVPDGATVYLNPVQATVDNTGEPVTPAGDQLDLVANIGQVANDQDWYYTVTVKIGATRYAGFRFDVTAGQTNYLANQQPIPAVTPASAIVRGPAGDAGPVGPTGPQGAPGLNQPAAGTPDGRIATSVGALNTYLDPGVDPLGSGKITANGGYLSTPGVNGSYAATLAAVSITGDFDVRIFLATPLTIAAGGFRSLVALGTAVDFRQQGSNGKPQLAVTGASNTNTASVGLATPPAGALGWRATWRASDGQTIFQALDAAGTVTTADAKKWTQVGNTATAPVTGNALLAGVKDVAVGALPANGTEGAALSVTRVEIRDGIDGTLVVAVDFSGHAVADAKWTDSAKAWRTYGTAAIVAKGYTVTKDGVTTAGATAADFQARVGGVTLLQRNPVSRKYKPEDFGPVGSSPEATRAAIQDATDKADSRGGGTVEFGTDTYVVGPNTALADPLNPTLPYAALLTRDNVRYEGGGPGSCIQLAGGANCHLFGPNGRTNVSGTQDHIDNVGWFGLLLDGNRANQDGTRTHDGLHIPQHPGLRVESVRFLNFDGDAYFSTSLGEFWKAPADANTSNINIVRPIWLNDVYSFNNAGWGYFMSATNRNTHYQSLHAEQNGSPQAQISGKTIAVNIASPGGAVNLIIDNNAAVNTVLTTGDTPATVVSKLNTALAGTATASLTPSGKLIVRSATVGGISKVYLQATSTAAVLANLGLTTAPINGDLNYRVGANQCGGFYLDHSQRHADGLTAQANYGDGVFIHNVNVCHDFNVQSVQNTGMGIYVEAYVASVAGGWIAGMNCTDFGAASYRSATAKSEIYFNNVDVGYGFTKYTTISGICAPGLKQTIGVLADNRHADYAVYVEDGLTLSTDGDHFAPNGLNLRHVAFGDGGLVANLRTPAGYVPG